MTRSEYASDHSGKPKTYKSSPKENCQKCLKALIGEYVTINGKKLHKACFGCTNCQKNLSSDGYMTKEEKPYCDDCYASLFSPKCAKCNQPITGHFLFAMEKKLHQSCFTCQFCEKVLDKDHFQVKDSNSYCDPCYERMFAMKCQKCGGAITGEALVAMGKNLHAKCFSCTVCAITIGTSEYKSENGQPYCDACYKKVCGTKCFKCKEPTMDVHVYLDGNYYHHACLICTGCNKSYQGQDFVVVESKFYCPACYQCHFEFCAMFCCCCFQLPVAATPPPPPPVQQAPPPQPPPPQLPPPQKEPTQKKKSDYALE